MVIYNKKEECCGCSACAQICPKNAIKMETDEEGFLYPKIDETKCVNCGLCKKACAFQNGYNLEDRLEKIKVFAAKSKDDEIRRKSSSGGMFTIIAEEILKESGTIYGAAFDENFKVKHIRIDSMEEIDKLRRAKYSQSRIGTTFLQVKQDLKEGKKVLFTGTPCQIGELRRFLNNIDISNLLLVDVVCHGTPSPKLFNEYIHFIEKDRKKKVIEYNHRSKTNLTGTSPEEIIYEGGEKDSTSRLSQTWRRIFYTNLPLRPSCYNCQYTNLKRAGDITIADFWGIEKYDKEIYDELGISLVIINTQKGNNFYKKIENKIIANERKIEEALGRNPQLQKPCKVNQEEREKFWNLYYKHGIKKIAQKYGKYTILGKIKHKVKQYIK